MAVVSRDPYRLALDVHGVGFKTADRIARGDRRRPRLAGAHAGGRPAGPPRRHRGGPRLDARRRRSSRARRRCSASRPRTRRCASASSRRVAVALRPGGARRSSRSAAAATRGRLRGGDARRRGAPRARASPRSRARRRGRSTASTAAMRAFESRARVELAPEQRSAVEEAARRQVLVVTGGPGVGKTTIVRAILAVLARAEVDVRLAAPTGRAAKRMSEATGAEATTLHRLLEFEPKTATFKRDRHRPIEAGAVVVDEASMLDLADGRRARPGHRPGHAPHPRGRRRPAPQRRARAPSCATSSPPAPSLRAPRAKSSARPRGASSSPTPTASTTASRRVPAPAAPRRRLLHRRAARPRARARHARRARHPAHPPPLRPRPRARRAGAHPHEPRPGRRGRPQRGAPGGAQPARRRARARAPAPTASATR